MSFFQSVGKALKSKTVWAGIGTTALGIGQLAAPFAPQILSFVPPGSPVGAGITIGLGVLAAYGRIKAKQPLGPVVQDTVATTLDAVHQLQISDPATQPQTVTGKVAQLAQVTAVVKTLQAQPKAA